uniref:DNA (cytosine-5-)-methyltransferase n=1 Tax=viral metagenome TaxID=1070528 RepID=A0A6C0CGA1_9ZZZZ
MPKYTCTQTGQTFSRKKDYVAHLESLVKELPPATQQLHEGRLAISLFSGAGGDTLGMEKAGVKVVAFSENNSACVKTHTEMFPDSKWLGESVKGDITKIPDEEFHPYVDKIFMVFAGFPCQGFSNAGKKDVSDPRNKMFHQFLRVVRIVRPEWIVGENVAGLLTKKTDDGESSVISVIENYFSEVRYPIVFNVYDMSKCGVPQSRKRLIIVGNRLSIPFVLPEYNNEKVGLEAIAEPVLDGAIETNLEIPDECLVQITDEVEPTGTPHPYMVLKHTEKLISFGKRDSPFHSEVLDLRNPCKTLICAYTFQPRLYIGLVKPNGKKYIRCLTVREAGQIQGFPKDYHFHGSRDDSIKQIGNAVPSIFIEKLVNSIINSTVNSSSVN